MDEIIAIALKDSLKRVKFTISSDTSPYKDKAAHVMRVTNAAGQERTALTIRTTSTEAGGEAAIALAITTGKFSILTE